MSSVKGLLVAAIAICGASTTAYAAPCESADQVLQIESLGAIYHSGGELPTDPSEPEISALRQLKAEPDLQEQAAFLECAFPGNEKLQAIAIRDHDGDGIKDYRITTSGKFRENDPDADCDGIANVLDDSPYDSAATPAPSSCQGEPDWLRITNDQNANGLPDQIDWRVLHPSGGASAAEVQEGLYRDYKIVLVDRQVAMPAAVAIEIDHVIRDIFRDQVVPEFPPLRVIASDRPACPGEDDYGWASPETSTLYVMPDTLALSPILRLEILVHEITHTLQHDLDFAEADLRGFRTRNSYDSDGFHTFASSLGWNAVLDTSQERLPAYRLAVRECDEFDYPFTLTYENRPGDAWKEDWAKFAPDNSGIPISLNKQLKDGHMFSLYGFTDAWEWDAEYRAAFVLNQLLDAASRLCTPTEVIALSDKLHADIFGNEWDYVNENARGLPSYGGVIAPKFHVDHDTWDALARRFLLASYPGVCGG